MPEVTRTHGNNRIMWYNYWLDFLMLCGVKCFVEEQTDLMGYWLLCVKRAGQNWRKSTPPVDLVMMLSVEPYSRLLLAKW